MGNRAVSVSRGRMRKNITRERRELLKLLASIPANCDQPADYSTVKMRRGIIIGRSKEVFQRLRKHSATLEASFLCGGRALKHLSNHGVDGAPVLREALAGAILAYHHILSGNENKAFSFLQRAKGACTAQEELPEVLHRCGLTTYSAIKCTLAAALTLQKNGSYNPVELETAGAQLVAACRSAIDAYIQVSASDNSFCSIIRTEKFS